MRQPGTCDGVSEIVGEMLLLAVVLVILAVFSSTIGDYLPSPRDPSVTIKISTPGPGHVILSHKGGDPVKLAELIVIVEDEKGTRHIRNITPGNPDAAFVPLGGNTSQFFDLGDQIEITNVFPGDRVSLATPRTVIFSHEVPV